MNKYNYGGHWRGEMCNVFEVAKKICEAGNWEVTNLHLQKMLYIAQVLYLGDKKKRLFNSKFEAWDYGPVSPKVYHEFKMFGNKPVEPWAFPRFEEECSKEKNDFIDGIANALAKVKPFTLVGLTHRPKTAWYKNYEPGAKGIEIPEEDMVKEFEEVWASHGK